MRAARMLLHSTTALRPERVRTNADSFGNDNQKTEEPFYIYLLPASNPISLTCRVVIYL